MLKEVYTVENIDTLDKEEFEKFVQSNKKANFFQSLLYFNVINNLKEQKPYLLVLYKSSKICGSILVVIQENSGLLGLKKILSKRAIIIGGPLYENAEDLETLMTHLDLFLRKEKVIYCEIRNLSNQNSEKNIFEKNGYQYIPYLNYLISLQKFQKGEIKLNKSKRNQKNKSLRNGSKIVEATNKEEVNQLYNIIQQLYKTKVKKPFVERQLFHNIFSLKNEAVILLIKIENTIIGGTIGVFFNDTYYDWFRAGLDQEYKENYPSVLGTWACIQFGIKKGLKTFDFLGAGKPNEDYGVREFKSQFGGELVEYGRFLKVYKPTLYKLGKFYMNLINKE